MRANPATYNLQPTTRVWQARRVSNPQPPVLETGALPIELLTYFFNFKVQTTKCKVSSNLLSTLKFPRCTCYFVSLCGVCLRQKRQYLLNSIRSVVFFLFFVVL